MATSAGKVILRSCDGEILEVEEAAVMLSQTIKHIIEDVSSEDAIPIPAVTGEILTKIVMYCKKHTEIVDKEELQAFDAEFVKVDDNTLIGITVAANYLEIEELLDLTCQAVADLIKDKPTEWIRKTFDIENEFTEEEEAATRKGNDSAFETD